MKFACERCGKRFASVDEPAPGRVYRIRCRCGNIIHISAPGAKAPASGARPDAQLRPDAPHVTGATRAPAIPAAPPARRSGRGAGDTTSSAHVPRPPPPVLTPDAPPAPAPDAAPPAAAPGATSHSLLTPLSALGGDARASEVPDLFDGIPDFSEASPAPQLPRPGTGEAPWPSPNAPTFAPRDLEPAPDPFAPLEIAASFPEDDPFAVAAAREERFDPPPVARRAAASPYVQGDEGEPAEMPVSERPSRAKRRKGASVAAAVTLAIVAGAAAFLWYQRSEAGVARVPVTAMPRVAPLPPPPAAPPAPLEPPAGAGAAVPAAAPEAPVPAPAPATVPTPEPVAPVVTPARDPHRPPAPPEEDASPPRHAAAPARIERKSHPALPPERPQAAERKVAAAAAPPTDGGGQPPPKTEPAARPTPEAHRAAASPPAPAPAPAARKEETPPRRSAEGLDPAAVRGIVGRSRPALEACVERALADPATASYAGQTAALLILVSPSGKADAAIEDGDLDATAFAHCLRRAVQKMKFPQFNGEEVAARIVLQLGSAR